MEDIKKLTVSEYSEIMGVSKQAVYGKIKRNKLRTEIKDDQLYIIVDKQVEQQLNNNLNNSLKAFEQPFNNSLKADFLENQVLEYKSIIENLRAEIKEKDLQIKELYNRLIEGEKLQKEEIIRVNLDKDQYILKYMDLLKTQTTNLLQSNPINPIETNPVKSDFIEADLEPIKPKKKYLSKSEFKDKMKFEKGLKATEIRNLIEKRLYEKDYRFIRNTEGKLLVLDENLEDLN